MAEQTNSTVLHQQRGGTVARVAALSKMSRLAYIDWMRGLACVLMFQTHCYDSWLSPAARKSSSLITWSQLGGTLPAPLFTFLAGVSFALGYLWSPWTDLLRVDILNILGLSMMLMGVLCWATGNGTVAAARVRTLVASFLAAAAVALITPPLWTTHRPRFLPWPLESYINGVHIFDKPQPWLFPLFPWSAFAFAGLAVGFYLFSDFGKRKGGPAFALLGGMGIVACFLSIVLDSSRFRLY